MLQFSELLFNFSNSFFLLQNYVFPLYYIIGSSLYLNRQNYQLLPVFTSFSGKTIVKEGKAIFLIEKEGIPLVWLVKI